MGRADPDEPRGVRGMDSNKTHPNVQSSRVFQLEEEIYRRRRLLRFKAVTENIVENALNTLDEICAEEIQGKNPLGHPVWKNTSDCIIIWIILNGSVRGEYKTL